MRAPVLASSLALNLALTGCSVAPKAIEDAEHLYTKCNRCIFKQPRNPVATL